MIDSNSVCCGCGVCEAVCPTKAISMKKNEYGFMVAYAEQSKCINCGMCDRRCPLIKSDSYKTFNPNYYAVVSKDRVSLKDSASGGAFYVFAKKTIELGGVVFGCIIDEAMNPVISYTDNIAGLKKMQGSKYVEADLKTSFAEAKSFLDDNKPVFYTGTPCKIAALKKYLNKDYENLVCCEIICHGVASPQLFRDYIDFLSKKLKGEIVDITFRDKKKGWGLLLKLKYKRGKKTHTKYLSYPESSYYYYFMTGDIYRDSCYQCPFASPERTSDITIGDFWGGRQILPDIDSDLGISAIITSTPKGQMLFDKCSDLFVYAQSDFETMSKENPNLLHPTERKDEADIFRKIYMSGGFAEIEKLHKTIHRKSILIGKIKRLMPYTFIKLIRKLRGVI